MTKVTNAPKVRQILSPASSEELKNKNNGNKNTLEPWKQGNERSTNGLKKKEYLEKILQKKKRTI